MKIDKKIVKYRVLKPEDKAAAEAKAAAAIDNDPDVFRDKNGKTAKVIRMHEEIKRLFVGYGYEPLFVEGDDPDRMHRLMAAALETAFDCIAAVQCAARKKDAHKDATQASRDAQAIVSPDELNKGRTAPGTSGGSATSDSAVPGGDPGRNAILSPSQLGYEGGMFKLFKGNKAEYDYLGPASVTCSRSIFPHGAPSCWWVERHKSQWE